MSYGRLVLAVIVWGAVTFGAVYDWAYWPLAIACALLGVAGLRSEAPESSWLRWLALLLAVITAGAAFQLLPLPRSVVLQLQPATDRFLSNFLLGYAANPSPTLPLSIDPAKTAIGLTLLMAFSLFLIGLIRHIPHTSAENLARRLTILAAVMAAFAVAQKALSGPDGTEKIYGFWRPYSPGNPFGPFVNRNHFAGWMLLAAPVAAGYALGLFERARPRGRGLERWRRWVGSPEGSQAIVVVLAVLSMGASIVVSGSRSGMIGFLVAVVVTSVFIWRRFAKRRRSTLFVVAGVALAVGLVLWSAGLQSVVLRFATASDDVGGRLSAWRDTERIIRDFPYFGTGIDAYGTAMLLYQTGDRHFFYREAHNDYLQIAAEGGAMVAVPALLIGTLLAVQIHRRFAERRDPVMTWWIRAGAVAALAGIATQSAVEFSLQMPGNAALFLVVLALAVHRPLLSVHALAARRAA